MTAKDAQAEAADPATPAERLAALLPEQLDAVLQNPAFPLLLTEQPDFWARVSRAGHAALARDGRCPPEFGQWVLRQRRFNPEVVDSLMQNAALPAALRRAALLRRPLDEDGWVDSRPFAWDLLSPAELDLLDRAVVDLGGGAPLAPADFGPLSAIGAVGASLAMRSPRCPSPVLLALLDSGSPMARAWVPRHVNLAPPSLAALLASPDVQLATMAATNPTLSAEQLRFVATHPSVDVRSGAAVNPSLSAAWVAVLLRDPAREVRESLAAHPALPLDAQLVLAADPEWTVRMALSEDQPGLAPEVRRVLDETNAKG
jgi:hypothetical protein